MCTATVVGPLTLLINQGLVSFLQPPRRFWPIYETMACPGPKIIDAARDLRI